MNDWLPWIGTSIGIAFGAGIVIAAHLLIDRRR